ncbi:MAG: hypothetical protein EP343_00705 [Deltaproteobacteria bacterium]|nr:MAG: hypothetical protein EP343_00705 [Deltaproteobacteria bacterium]
MNIEIFGCESLGVRSMACRVRTASHDILIDPGVALAPNRSKHPPHPIEMENVRAIQEQIKAALRETQQVVFTHYHGDHFPMVKPDETQLSAHDVLADLQRVLIHSKSEEGLSRNQKRRRANLEELVGRSFPDVDDSHHDGITYSESVWHGEEGTHLGKVIMVRVEEGSESFVHASDIQLLDDRAVDILCEWRPTVTFFSGPPLYILGQDASLIAAIQGRFARLSEACGTVIVDHHLLRSRESEAWFDQLTQTHPNITCAADYKKQPRKLLEADRVLLYEQHPVA